MKALTICQRYASLIVNPPHLKRIENRTWETLWTGPLAIHAGKSRSWLTSWDGAMPDAMPFGAVIGAAKMIGCLHLESWRENPRPMAGIDFDELKQLMNGEFAEGPFCWVLTNIIRIPDPVPCPGAQGLWYLPPRIVNSIADVSERFARLIA